MENRTQNWKTKLGSEIWNLEKTSNTDIQWPFQKVEEKTGMTSFQIPLSILVDGNLSWNFGGLPFCIDFEWAIPNPTLP